MSALPNGVITFLFTDVAGSSSRFEQQGGAMHAALARHDAALRKAIQRHGGHLFKTWGDAFLAAFSVGSEAVAAALEAQIEVRGTGGAESAGPLQVRMAIHTGPAETRDGDYFGDTLNRTSRLLRVAHGGQILLSGATAEAIGTSAPPSARIVDLGEHHLRDLQRAERVFELQHPALPSGLPPLLSLENMPTNLPQQSTSFIGREREIAEVKRLLASTRLLTLIGTGGCGKTRLALHVGTEVLDEYPDGVWLVELAPLRDPAFVGRTACFALRLPEEQGRDALTTLIEHVRGRRMLLVLDNCEHLIEAAAKLAGCLLRECPSIRILATSRERLQITGETVWRTPSLALPPARVRNEAPTAALQSESARLFCERARSADPSFDPQTAVEAICEICRRLDGIPLAIELAAALVGSMPPASIAEHLDHFFQVLTRGSRTAMERHQTLRAAIQWSYDLLTADEQTLFNRLSAFRGGWSLTAAQAVCSAEGASRLDVLDRLARLVDKSLVHREDGQGGAPRYRMLETVRQFAQERLDATGEEERVARAHHDYYASLAEEAAERLRGPEQKRVLDQLDQEHDNLRAALAGCDSATRTRLSVALHRFWLMRGHLTEGREWLSGALEEAGDVPDASRAKAANALGVLCWAQGDLEEALTQFSQALRIARARGDLEMLPGYLNNLAMLACEVSDYAQAEALYSEALALYRQSDDLSRVGSVLTNLGVLMLNMRDFASARRYLEEATRIQEPLGDRAAIATCRANLARLHLDTGHTAEARSQAVACRETRREIGDARGMADIDLVLALADVAEGDYAGAVRRIASIDAVRTALTIAARPQESADIENALSTCREKLTAAGFEDAWQRGIRDALEVEAPRVGQSAD